ncbi:hypothetical protein ACFZAT_24645 [Streptomyces sp. NPDC008163]|uniref:hypothetical protein n=1 Tax=Streptomyces sp. NPDC008163 TaxID=3364818 RepID=UPI0036E8F99F
MPLPLGPAGSHPFTNARPGPDDFRGPGPCQPAAYARGGGLERAGLLEATAALFIGLWVGEGADAQAIAPPAGARTRCPVRAGARTRGAYALTDLGRTLPGSIDAIGAWAFEHGDEVMAAQDAGVDER